MRHAKKKVLSSLVAIIVALTALTLIFTNQQPIYGQGDGVLPWVVDTVPARGEELTVDSDITLTFNAVMNRRSVEAAFRVSPAASGTFRWQDDSTVSFVPDKPLDRETAYIFEMDSNARSIDGLALRDTFALKLHTTGYLTVTQFLPQAEGVSVELKPTITLVFNRPVVALGTAEQMQSYAPPFQSNPSMKGFGEWLTTSIYSFKPSENLAQGTDYTITVPTGLTDVSGSTVKEALTFHFKTISKAPIKPKSFAIHYLSPEDGRAGIFLTPLIRVGFDGPADTASAEAGFSLIGPDGRVIPGTFEWKDKNHYEMRFRPSERLEYSTRYTIKMDRTNVRSKTGLPLITNAKATFTTLNKPEIVRTSPDDGTLVDPTASLNFLFNTPMKLDDFASRIEIVPKTPFAVLDSDISQDFTTVRVQFSKLPSTIYTVTLNTKGMVDIWGTPLIVKRADKAQIYRLVDDDKLQIRFVTSSLGSAISLETNGQEMGLYNAYHQTRVFVTHRNINTVGMVLYNWSLSKFLNANSNGALGPDATETLLRRWVVPVYNPPNVMRYDLLSITTDGISIGQAGNVVCVEAAPSSLAVGQQVRVVRREVPADETQTPGAPAPLNVRNKPGMQDTVVVGQAPNGSDFAVLDGPVCADRYVWWRVQSADGALDGWIAEGDLKQPYVVPLTDQATPAVTTPTPTPITGAAAPITVPTGHLQPGIYRIEMQAPDIANNSRQISHLMLVATDNITLKIAQREALAWVTDLKSGEPAAGLSVQFYRLWQLRTGQQVRPFGPPVQTDKNGLARLNTSVNLYPAGEVIYAAINSDGHFGVASSIWTQGIDAGDFQQPTMFNSRDLALYLYTDRRLYRPGEKVYFRGTLRQRTDAVYGLTDKTMMPVEIIDPFNQTIYSKKLPINEYGSFSDSFTIDAGGQLGEYRIIARPNKPDPTPTPSMTPTVVSATPAKDGTPLPTPYSPPLAATPTQIPIYEMPVQQARELQQPVDPAFTTQITVAEYTPPEFRVAVTAQSAHVAPGDTIRTTVESSYYFGGPVSNAVVQWTVRTDPYYFFYTGTGYYNFEDYNQDQIGQDYEDDRPQIMSSGTGRTDDQGRYVLELPAALGKSRRSLIYTIEAVVWDQSNQMVAERGQVVVDQGQFQIGVGVNNYVGAVGDKQTIRLITVDHNSEPRTNTDVEVRVVRREWASVQTIEPGTGRTVWENEVVEKDVTSAKLKTDATGKATFDFTPQRGGAYKIYAITHDSQNNEIKSSTFIWIAGADFAAWRAPNSQRIDLQADKTSYKVDDIASILIPTPFQGTSTALITVERGGILHREVFHLQGNSTIYKLRITPDMAPNAFVSVTVIKGEDEHNFTAAFRTGLIQLNVASDQLGLNVKVTSDRSKLGPRDEVTYNIHVTNALGEPMRAEVGLALVDEAIIALLPDNLPSLMAYFYSRQGLGVRTANSLIYNIDQTTQEIINVQKGGGKGGDDYTGIFTIRKNYITTPLWAPSIITDRDGNATVKVRLPDQLTTWVLDARAYTLPTGETNTTLVGQTTHSIVSTKPLLIRPEVPRFFVVGDESLLSAIVNNNADEPQEVAVSLDISGANVQGDLMQYATIPANSRQKFDWRVTVGDAPAVDMTFKVVSKDGRYTDAAKPVTGEGDDKLLPVLRYETPDTVTTGGVIGNEGGNRTEGILVPANGGQGASQNDVLEVHIDRSLATSMTTALKTLEVFPYYCIEQTVSRFLPDAVMFRAQKALGVNDPKLQTELEATLETAFQRIYSDQHVDGGWGWFINDSSDQLISAYVVLGMTEAKAAGWQVDRGAMIKAVKALRDSLKDVNDKTSWWDLNRQAFILYVLARSSQVTEDFDPIVKAYDVSRSVKLFDQRDRMNLDALAFLAMDFAIIEPSSGYHVKPLMDTVKRAAKYSLTGRHWEDVNADAWNWTTDTRTTAIVLKALVATEPDSPLIADTVRWLMTARKFDAWETTQETAWSVMALTAWMEQSGDLTPDYKFGVTVNDKALASGEQATTDNARTGYDLRIAVADLLGDQVNRLAVERTAGAGTMYYSAQLKTYLPVEQVKPISRGLMIERKYSLDSDKTNTPISEAHVGDRIRVTLTIIVPETLNYVVIEDPIPAGTAAIDTSLQTAQKLDAKRPLEYGWKYWVFTHTELRDDRTVLYAPYLPKGTYQFIYELRAGAEGTYHVMPANGHAFYMPEVFGRSDGEMFKVWPPVEPVAEIPTDFPVQSKYKRN